MKKLLFIGLLSFTGFGLLAQENLPKTAKEYRKNGTAELVVSLAAFSGSAALVSYMASGKANLDSYGFLVGGSLALAGMGIGTMISANKNFKKARTLEAQVTCIPLSNQLFFSKSPPLVPGIGLKFRF